MSFELRQELSCKQILTHELTLTPEAICPRCQYVSTEAEIHAGWTQNPVDTKTTCPSCKFRFVASLFVTSPNKLEIRVAYMCVVQVFFKIDSILQNRKNFTKVYGKKRCPDIYYTLCKHFDSFENGMEKYLNKEYRASM